MTLLQRLAAGLFAMVLSCGPALAAPQDAIFNKEHVWAIDVDHGACAVSRLLNDGSTFLFRAKGAGLTFGFFPRTRVRTGRAGRVEIGVLGFDFNPSFGEDASSLFYDGELNEQAVAALWLAPDLRVLVDSRPVVAMTLSGTGFAEALEGVLACARGEAGWWGTGVDPDSAANDLPRDKGAGPFVMNKEGVWGIAARESPGVCIAQADLGRNMQLQILSAQGREGLAIATTGQMPAGKQAHVETDNGVFDVRVTVDKARRYLSMDDPLDAEAIAILHNSKWLRISLDRRVLLDVRVEDTGFTDVLEAVADCSTSRSGWWGEGAKPARPPPNV